MSETISAPEAFVHYSNASYDYYCTAPPRTPLTTPAWKVSRISKSTLREEWAANSDGRLEFNLATDLATVAALDFA